MQLEKLWEELSPNVSNIEVLKKDLAEGKVPELPYFIVGQQEVKKEISARLMEIKGQRMQTNLILGLYGNGKTNLLKYLQLYFKNYNTENIKVIYSRVDVDQPDIIIFILKLIQAHSVDELTKAILKLRDEQFDVAALAHDFEDDFASIKDYAYELFNNSRSEEEVKKLIYLGTGRLYTIGHFSNFGLEQLSNFNRREVLVLFLNIFAYTKSYFVFGIDEIEKLQEKSRLRFNQFLTSYRELIDLSNKIQGHYLITCFSNAIATSEIRESNPAFYSRIEKNIQELPAMNSAEDINLLSIYLSKLFKLKTSDEELRKLVTQARKLAFNQNRALIRYIVELLLERQESYSLDQLLERKKINQLYKDTFSKMEYEGTFKSINRKFFDPLEFYLESKHLLEDGNRLERRDNQAFIDKVSGKVHYFIFNENSLIENINKRINEIILKNNKDVVVYSPVKLELKNSNIDLESSTFSFEIVDYDPNELFVLLTMFRENFDKQDDLSDIIASYTENNL